MSTHLCAMMAIAALTQVPQSYPTQAQLLERAAAYVDGYMQDLSGVVAEEVYEEILTEAPGARPGQPEKTLGHRVLKSDFLLVRADKIILLPGIKPPKENAKWTAFRDVFEADNVPVRDRGERLQKLFLEPKGSASPFDQAGRISDESARFNIGRVTRNTNVPTLALQFLQREAQGRFKFELGKAERIEGVVTMRVQYRETARPTFIRTSRDADALDVPVKGTLWLEPETGRIVRAEVNAEVKDSKSKTIVTFRHDPKVEMWVPAEMKETVEYEDEMLKATATYSKYRKFQVTTEEHIKK